MIVICFWLLKGDDMINKYVKSLAVGLTVLGLTDSIIGQEQKQPVLAKHTLTSTPDAQTELNGDLATKVRKVAELIISNEKGKYKKHVDNIGLLVKVRGWAVSEDKGYEFSVSDQTNNLKKIVPTVNPTDSMILAVYSLTENNEREVHVFFDYGLDGNLNVAKTYVGFADTLFPPENLFPPESLLSYKFEEEQLTEIEVFRKEADGEVTNGEEYQEKFQTEYERVLDRLIELYQQD